MEEVANELNEDELQPAQQDKSGGEDNEENNEDDGETPAKKPKGYVLNFHFGRVLWGEFLFFVLVFEASLIWKWC